MVGFYLKDFITERLLSHDFMQPKLETQTTLKIFSIPLILRIDGSHPLCQSRRYNNHKVARETSTTDTFQLKGRCFHWSRFGHFQMSILLVHSRVLPQVPAESLGPIVALS